MPSTLIGKRVAILATHGFEPSELLRPRAALDAEGAITQVISPEKGSIRGWTGTEFGDGVPVDLQLADARAAEFDALLLPGGVISPDKLRVISEAVEFVHAFFSEGKPVGAICHGLQLLIEADVVCGRKLTSVKAIRTDLINAGARWSDEPVVTDQGLVTSRTPADIPHFIRKLIEEIGEGVHSESGGRRG